MLAQHRAPSACRLELFRCALGCLIGSDYLELDSSPRCWAPPMQSLLPSLTGSSCFPIWQEQQQQQQQRFCLPCCSETSVCVSQAKIQAEEHARIQAEVQAVAFQHLQMVRLACCRCHSAVSLGTPACHQRPLSPNPHRAVLVYCQRHGLISADRLPGSRSRGHTDLLAVTCAAL